MTITVLRRRARGPGSEFSLPTDTRFTSRERGVLGQFEVDDLDLDARIADFTDDR